MKRNGMVDIYRLLFIFLIMAHHLYLDIPFASAWVYVEFFFILSGYFTMKHYALGVERKSVEEKASETITYTLHKFKRIMPYVVIAVLLEYGSELKIVGFQGKRELLSMLENMVFELCLLSSSGLANAYVAPIWYLSAMFLVFPLFTFMLSFKEMHKWYYGFLSWFIAALYYGKVGVVPREHDLLRAFACLWLGVFVYGASETIKQHRKGRCFDIAVTLFEIGSFVLTVICTGYNTGNGKLIVFAFVIGSSALLSGCSLTSKIPSIPFIGELSMVLFLMHWHVRTTIGRYIANLAQIHVIVMYYVISICLSVFLLLAGCMIKKSNGLKDK